MQFVVLATGGRGPNTWDTSFTVEADNLPEAVMAVQSGINGLSADQIVAVIESDTAVDLNIDVDD